VNCPFGVQERPESVDWLLGLAVRFEYGDNGMIIYLRLFFVYLFFDTLLLRKPVVDIYIYIYINLFCILLTCEITLSQMFPTMFKSREVYFNYCILYCQASFVVTVIQHFLYHTMFSNELHAI